MVNEVHLKSQFFLIVTLVKKKAASCVDNHKGSQGRMHGNPTISKLHAFVSSSLAFYTEEPREGGCIHYLFPLSLHFLI